MALGIRGANPIWTEFDLTGHLFDDTFFLWVLENEIPYIPATVYHDADLNTAWTNPIQFLANGTLPIDIFFQTDNVYRLEFRQHSDLSTVPTQADPLIYLVENYIGGSSGSNPVDVLGFASENQITNPQFAITTFTDDFSLTGTNPNPIEIGPGWYLELGGTGAVSLVKVPLNSANKNPSNAPYALEIALAGWTTGTCFLRQRFYLNGMLWANKYVSTTITAKLNGAPQNISASLIASNTTPLGKVLDTTKVDQNWTEFTGNVKLGATTNTNTPPNAYIDYKLALPSNIDIYVTSIQLIVQDTPTEPGFNQDSVNRQIDHMYHDYNLPLQFKPIPSFLVGWDFGLNPAQPAETFFPTAFVSLPTWDQTITFSSLPNNLTMSRSSGDGRGAYKIACANAPTQTAMIQYIDRTKLYNILTNDLSVNVEAFTNGTSTLGANVSLWVTNNGSLPNLSAGTTFVTTLDANGHPSVVVGGWTEITRGSSLGNANFTITSSAGKEFNNYGMNGWNAANNTASDALIDTATFAAIVVGTAPIAVGNVVLFNSISLVPGRIATRPAPQTVDEVLRECEYYFEKSYSSNVYAGQIMGSNALLYQQDGFYDGAVTIGMFATAFDVRLRTPKRAVPIIDLYSPTTGTKAVALATVSSLGVVRTSTDISVTNWDATPGTKNIYYIPNNTTQFLTSNPGFGNYGNVQAKITYQYVADARLGVV